MYHGVRGVAALALAGVWAALVAHPLEFAQVVALCCSALAGGLAIITFLFNRESKLRDSIDSPSKEMRNANAALISEVRDANAALISEVRSGTQQLSDRIEALSKEMRDANAALSKDMAYLQGTTSTLSNTTCKLLEATLRKQEQPPSSGACSP